MSAPNATPGAVGVRPARYPANHGCSPWAPRDDTFRPMLKTTPFHERTAPLVRAHTWRRWAGHQIASAYDPHPDREYAAIRSSAALIDVSPLYKYRIAGPDAERLLDRTVKIGRASCRERV